MLRTVLASAAVFAAPAPAIALQKADVNREHPTDAAVSGGSGDIQLAALESGESTPRGASPSEAALLAYAALQNDINTLRALPLKSSADVDKALSLVVRHDPVQVAQGYYVYLGIAAAQEQAFAAESRSLVEAYGRERLVEELPRSKFGAKLTAAPGAMVRALGAANADSQRFFDTASLFHEHAMKLQRQPWAKKPVARAANQARLQRVRAAAEAPAVGDASLSARFDRGLLASAGLDQPGAVGSTQFWSPQVSDVQLTSYRAPQSEALSREDGYISAMGRTLTFSILYSIEAEDENATGIRDLLASAAAPTANCIQLQRQSFYSALSSAQFEFESVGAVRAHLDTYAECFAKVTGKSGA